VECCFYGPCTGLGGRDGSFFLERLYSYQIQHGADDRVVWSLSKRGHFEVKSYYKALDSQEGSSFSC
jgi:hypothetical protein